MWSVTKNSDTLSGSLNIRLQDYKKNSTWTWLGYLNWTTAASANFFEKRCPSSKRQAFFFKLWDSFIKDQFISSFSPHSLFSTSHDPPPFLIDHPYVFFFEYTSSKNNSSVYFTVQNWSKSPKKYPHFFQYCLYEKKKKTSETKREEHHRRPKQSWAFRFFRRI